MLFNCKLCNYSTNDRSNYNKHTNSKKHLIKTTKNNGYQNKNNKVPKNSINTQNSNSITQNNEYFICRFCNKNFTRKYNLERHYKSCSKVSNQNSNLSISNAINTDKLMYELQLYKEKINMLETINEKVTTENNYLRQSNNNSGYVSKKSVSALNFIVEKYNNAPPLRKIKDSEYKKLDTPENDSLEVTLIRKYNVKQLDSYLGGFIVGMYYKKDPSKQSVWTSDTSRLTYFIKQLLKGGDSKWITDKKGVKFKEIVIRPLLDFVAELLNAYTPDMLEEIEKSRPIWSMEVILEYQTARTKILMAIDDHSLEDQILKYAAPYLFVDRSESSNNEIVKYNKKKYK